MALELVTLERQIQAFMKDPDAGASIHTNSVARGLGYTGALVTGSIAYGWCVPLIIEALGEGWVAHGWAEVQFRRPVYATDLLTLRLEPTGGEAFSLTLLNEAGAACITGAVGLGEGAWVAEHVRSQRLEPEPLPDPRPVLYLNEAPVGQDLSALRHRTEHEAVRPSDVRPEQGRPLALLLGERAVVNPAILVAMGSWYGHAQYAYEGPSIHVFSRVQHQGLIDAGDTVTVAGHCVEAYERNGNHYWTTDTCLLSSDGREVARMRYSTAFKVAGRSRG